MSPQSAILAVVTSCSLCLGIGGYVGYGFGVTDQKVADQDKFDKINDDRNTQVSEANAKYQALLKKRITEMAEYDKLKSDLEKEREQNRITTDGLRTKLGTLRLRYRAAQGPGDRGRRGSPGTASNGGAEPLTSEVAELPAMVTGNLRQLTLDADKLNDDYRQCYNFLTRSICTPKTTGY